MKHGWTANCIVEGLSKGAVRYGVDVLCEVSDIITKSRRSKIKRYKW